MKKIFSMRMQKRLLLSKAGLLLHQILVPCAQRKVTTITSDSGSMCSAKSDYHHFTGLSLFKILAVKMHCLGSV